MLNIGCCGDVCDICPRYIASQSDDEKCLRDVALLWQMVGWWKDKESPQELTCHGCASVSHCDLGVRECALEKNIKNCGKCTKYPCIKLIDIFKQNEKEAAICKELFSAKDYKVFQEVFFSKNEILNKINNEKKTRAHERSELSS